MQDKKVPAAVDELFARLTDILRTKGGKEQEAGVDYAIKSSLAKLGDNGGNTVDLKNFVGQCLLRSGDLCSKAKVDVVYWFKINEEFSDIFQYLEIIEKFYKNTILPGLRMAFTNFS